MRLASGFISHRRNFFPHGSEHLGKTTQCIPRPSTEASNVSGSCCFQGFAETDVVVFRVHSELPLGFITNAALGNIDDSSHADGVIRVFQYTQVGHNVANLFTLVELRATDHLVWDTGADENIFQCTRGVIRPVHHRNIVVAIPLVAERIDLGSDKPRLIVLIVRHIPNNVFACALIGPQLFLSPPRIISDHGIGSGQNILR